MTHELKTINPYFRDIWASFKTFEVRKNDRNFCTGDTLVLKEYSDTESMYSGREVIATVTSALKNYPGIAPDYIVMSIRIDNKRHKRSTGGTIADTYVMVSGLWKGTAIANVPATYLLWVWENKKCSAEVSQYVEANISGLRAEAKTEKPKH